MWWYRFKLGLHEGFGWDMDLPDHGDTVEIYPCDHETELAEYREVLAAYVERDTENQRMLVEVQGQIEARTEELTAARRAIAEFASVKATRDRYQANGKKIAAEKRDLEAVLMFPGARAALLHTLHSDHHANASAGERRARDEMLIKLIEIYKRLNTVS